jgi:hypothetical protein
VTTFSDISQMRGGATTYTFDGAGSIVTNEKCSKVVGLVVNQSLSARTNDEGNGMAVKLECNSWAGGNRIFPIGWVHGADTAANACPQHTDYDILPLNIPTPPQSTISINIAGTLGATGTGTYDTTVGILYSDAQTPNEYLLRSPNCYPAAGGDYGYIAALATTTRTAFSTFTIPAWAKAVVGVRVRGVFDTAVTADEEFTSFAELDLGIGSAGVQKFPGPGAMPQDGTDVDGGQCINIRYIPTYIPLPSSDLTCKGYLTAYSAISGGADYELSLIWI